MFKDIFSFWIQGQPHFKSKPLSAIDESVVKASQAIEQVSGKQLRCLEEAVKALKFIEWIRNEIKGNAF